MSGTEPIVSVQVILNAGTPVNAPQRILFIGQKIAAGTASPDTLIENIENNGEEDVLFGAKSMLAGMIRAFKRINQISQVDAIPLDDAVTAVKATGTVGFSGTSTADGVYKLTVGSALNHVRETFIPSGTIPNNIADFVADSFNDDLTVPANITDGTITVPTNVDIEAINGGTEGNNIAIILNGSIPGVTTSIGGMGGGAVDPDTSVAFGIIPDDIRYQQIVVPSYALLPAATYLNSVFNLSNRLGDGVAVATNTDTLSNLKAQNVTVGALHDSVLFGNKKAFVITDEILHEGPAVVELNYELSSIFASVKALRLTVGAPISQFIQSAGASLDAFGGPALASLPYYNTVMPNVAIVGSVLNWSEAEIVDLGSDGVSVFVNNNQRTAVVPRSVFVGFKNLAGTNGFLNITDTVSQAREYFFNQYKLRFGQTRLTSGDDFLSGRAIVNKAIIEAVTDGLYIDLAGADFALMRGDDDTISLFKQNRVVTLDLETGSVTVNMLVFPIAQLRKISATLEVSFLTAGIT